MSERGPGTHPLLFEGAYNDAVKREGVVNEDGIRSNDSLEPAHITKGRGTDDAPQGALMIHVALLTAIDEKLGPVPLFGHTIDHKSSLRKGGRNMRVNGDAVVLTLEQHVGKLPSVLPLASTVPCCGS